LFKGVSANVLIDDGVFTLSIPKTYDANDIDILLKYIDDGYKVGGQEISWDKCYVSEKLLVFLNEVYFNGNLLGAGMKSIIKMVN